MVLILIKFFLYLSVQGFQGNCSHVDLPDRYRHPIDLVSHTESTIETKVIIILIIIIIILIIIITIGMRT